MLMVMEASDCSLPSGPRKREMNIEIHEHTTERVSIVEYYHKQNYKINIIKGTG